MVAIEKKKKQQQQQHQQLRYARFTSVVTF